MLEEVCAEVDGVIVEGGVMRVEVDRVPARSYFMLGDHRSMSNDSRDFGPVKEGYIYGKAVFGYWPMEKLGRLR